jgi:hypothetical protein
VMLQAVSVHKNVKWTLNAIGFELVLRRIRR